jgi:[ribosomal protein S18]-alanine N-acetyltransferase
MSADNRTIATEVSVRPAEAADFESLHDVDGRLFGELGYQYFVLRQLFDAFRKCWLVAAGPSGLIGYSFGVPGLDGESAWLFGLAVEPNHRNRGYGTRLTRASLAVLSGMGVDRVSLTVEPENAAAIRLYRRFCFVESEFRANYFGPGEDRLVMSRRLSEIPEPRPDFGRAQSSSAGSGQV